MLQVKTPKDAELNAAEKMRSWGYVDAASPLHSADGGIDVRSSRALAQVKFRSVKAGRPEIQNLVGAAAGDTTKVLMFFDYKGYSPQAVQYADQMGVGLYVYNTSGVVTSINGAARRLMGASLQTRLATALSDPSVRVVSILVLGIGLAILLMYLAIAAS